jgi:hypothetical protein
MMQISKKHHYLPVFYTKRWAGPDGRVCEFSKPYGNQVKPKKVHPDGTGYVLGLYDLKGLPGELRDQFERLLLKEVDTKAADALVKLEQDVASQHWSADERSAWTRFLLALMFRMPEDVADLKAYSKIIMTKSEPEFDVKYAALRQKDDPDSWAEWLKEKDPHLVENQALRLSQYLMNHERIGKDINNFRWYTIRTLQSDYELVTSDRPLVITGMGENNSVIYLPIGPRRIFAAVREGGIKELSANEQTAIAKSVNISSVEGAVKYVYGTDDRQLRFIQNRMGKNQKSRWASRLLQKEIQGSRAS